MNVIRCKNGHFFDGDSYITCPHCGETAMTGGEAPVKEEKKGFWGRGRKEKETDVQPISKTPSVTPRNDFGNGSTPTDVMDNSGAKEVSTPPLEKNPTLDFWQTSAHSEIEAADGGKQEVTEPSTDKVEEKSANITGVEVTPVAEQVEVKKEEVRHVDENAQNQGSSLLEAVKKSSASNEGKTMSYFSSATSPSSVQSQPRPVAEPVVGWLVCVGGCHFGECFSIFAGKNSIGRSEENRIVIADDNSISRIKHALIVYEPKKRNFYLQPGDSSGLTYLNEDYITESHKLSIHDMIELGDSKFMFVPLCGEAFSWEEHMPKGEQLLMKRCFACFKEYEEAFQVCPHCGSVEITKPKEPIHLVPGTVLANRYILGQAVGSGGFGIVYSAWDLKLETIVAVKEFFVSRLVARAEGLKNLIITKKSMEEFEYRKERFLAEARNMAKFGSHRSIPNVFEFFEENNTAYIVMELLRGVALNDYLNQSGGKIDIDFALMIANEVGNALKSLHEQNIVHRDVAPDNIYICSGKEIKIKLMDLGAAKLADSTDDVIDIILKPGYSPTEQYDNSKNIGPWTDIYALGASLYVMLTGVKPDESTNRKINDEVVPPHLLNPLVSENLSNAIMKAMAIEKHMRFKTVQEFLSAINGERKIIPLAKEKKRRSLKRFVGIAVACLVLLIGSFFAYDTYLNKQEEQFLDPADIVVWFSVTDGSSEEDAMLAIKADFEQKYEGVTVEVVAIPESEYENRIREAAKQGKLPTLFESSGLPADIIEQATDLDNVLSSDQFKNAMFLSQYNDFYSNKKQMPLAIEVPIAYVVTSGASCIDYSDKYFEDIDDFNASNIAYDDRYLGLLQANFELTGFCEKGEFLNNSENTSPVMLSSTMALNEIRTTLTNYEKTYVYYDSDEIYCRYIYEWSIGDGEEAEIEAAERLLSWMLGNVYQSYLMISECNDGQIPVNAICFDSKIRSKYLAAISDIHQKFVFEGMVEKE